MTQKKNKNYQEVLDFSNNADNNCSKNACNESYKINFTANFFVNCNLQVFDEFHYLLEI